MNVMKQIVLVLNVVFEYIAIGIVYLPFIALYILCSPLIFLTWLVDRWNKTVRWAKN